MREQEREKIQIKKQINEKFEDIIGIGVKHQPHKGDKSLQFGYGKVNPNSHK